MIDRAARLVGEANLITIGVIAGDGVGPEVIAESLAGPRARSPRRRLVYSCQPVDLGGERYLGPARSSPTPRSDELRRCDAILPGGRRPSPACRPASWRRGSCSGSGSISTSTSTSAPSGSIPGVETPIRGKGPDDIDMVVVRENNEDLYVGAGGFTRKGTPEEVAIQTSINTRAGVERLPPLCLRPGPRQASVGGRSAG